jgi:MFS family permease
MLYPFATATYVPCATILFEWFSERRGLAAGIMYAGTGVGGTIFPFLISGLINRFGYKAAMVSLGLGYGIIGSLALLPIKRRVPLPRRRGSEVVGNEGLRRPRASLRFMKDRLVWIGLGIIMVSSLGNFIPSLWLPGALQWTDPPLNYRVSAKNLQRLRMISMSTPVGPVLSLS